MAMKVKSIAAKDLAHEVRAAVSTNPALKGLKIETGVALSSPWLVGFVVRTDQLENKSIKELQGLATDVAQSLPPVQGAAPAALTQPGHIIIGFVEDAAVTMLKE